jgi:hypothetical protein
MVEEILVKDYLMMLLKHPKKMILKLLLNLLILLKKKDILMKLSLLLKKNLKKLKNLKKMLLLKKKIAILPYGMDHLIKRKDHLKTHLLFLLLNMIQVMLKKWDLKIN